MLILLDFNFHDVLILFAQTASPAFTLYIRREETILSHSSPLPSLPRLHPHSHSLIPQAAQAPAVR